MINFMVHVFTIIKNFFKLFGKGIHRLYQIAKGVCDTQKNVKKAALIQIIIQIIQKNSTFSNTIWKFSWNFHRSLLIEWKESRSLRADFYHLVAGLELPISEWKGHPCCLCLTGYEEIKGDGHLRLSSCSLCPCTSSLTPPLSLQNPPSSSPSMKHS